ncbi:MAG TPA: PspC domain-containing protein [Candidatus Dormibacteraeota bacterium]|nr:PspC domain-containing protein [Candidatus Dormibacteraeota bacterium]
MSERLERSSRDRVLAGLCGGIAEYYVIAPGFVRALFVVATIMTGGMFLFVYIFVALLIPAHVEETNA